MPETFARIASIALALAFAWAALAKFTAYSEWRAALARYRVPERTRGVIALGTPFVELFIAITILVVSARVGAAAGLAALAAFSLAILNARTTNGDRLPCGCFGGSSDRDYRTMLVRNGFLGVLAAVVLAAGDGMAPALSSIPEPTDALPAALVIAGGAFILWIAWQTSVSLRRRSHQ